MTHRQRSCARLVVPLLLVTLASALLPSSVAGQRQAEPRPAPADPAAASLDLNAPHAPGELLVRFKPGVSAEARQTALAEAGASEQHNIPTLDLSLAKLTDDANDDALLAAAKVLEANPDIAYAEPNYRVQADAAVTPRVPDDPSFGQQWGLDNTGQWAGDGEGTPDADIDAPEAWAVTTGSPDVVVGIIDTGVDFSSPDLGGSMNSSARMWRNPGENCAGCQIDGVDNDGNGYVDDWRGWDFANDDNNPYDDNGHGTHVAGILGASGDNGLGTAGVSWSTTIMALKFLDAGGGGTVADAIEAINYASAMGVTITSNSWGGLAGGQSLRDAIEAAGAGGMLFIAAAGNDSTNSDDVASFPADYTLPYILSVGASDNRDNPAWFSNFGVRAVDLSAPGVAIYSTYAKEPEYPYAWLSGTSMATPFVTGTAALVNALNPDADALALKALLLRTVDPVPQLTSQNASGGRLNAANAVNCQDAPVLWVDEPRAGFAVEAGQTVRISALAGDCADAEGVTVSADVNGVALALESQGDGLYTGVYTADALGPLALTLTATVGARHDTQVIDGATVTNYRIANVPYAWIDATAGGTQTGIVADDGSELAQLPFAFTFYDRVLDSVTISANGYLTPGATPADYFFNSDLPALTNPNGLIAPFWDDLNPEAGGSIWYRTLGAVPQRQFVVAWLGLPHYDKTGDSSFEVILDEASQSITFQYADTSFGDKEFDDGASASIGVEHPAGTVGRQFSTNEPSLKLYTAQQGIRFTLAEPGAPSIDTFQLESATVGDPYSAQLAASGGTLPYAWSVADGGLPPGLQLATDGTLSGTPTTQGAWTFTVELRDSSEPAFVEQQLLALDVVIGYRYSDVSFNWLDAASGGTSAGITADDSAVRVDLPFVFTFYDEPFTSAQVSSNGYLVFGDSDASTFSNTALPTESEPNGVVAALWDDLSPQAGGGVWTQTFGEAPNRTFVVEWLDTPHYKEFGAGTFEIQLHEGSNDIEFQYVDTNFDISVYDFGAAATIGVENLTGTTGAQFSYDESVLAAYDSQKGLRFSSNLPDDLAPRITSSAPTQAVVGQPLNYQATAWGQDGVLTWSLNKAPDGMTIDPASGLLTWTPSEPGTYDVSIQVSDANGNATQEWQVTVTGGV